MLFILNVIIMLSVNNAECLGTNLMHFDRYKVKHTSKYDVPMLLNEIYVTFSITTLRKVTLSITILSMQHSA